MVSAVTRTCTGPPGVPDAAMRAESGVARWIILVRICPDSEVFFGWGSCKKLHAVSTREDHPKRWKWGQNSGQDCSR